MGDTGFFSTCKPKKKRKKILCGIMFLNHLLMMLGVECTCERCSHIAKMQGE